MFRFEHPEFFWLLGIPAGLWAMYYFRKYLRERDWLKWGSKDSNQKAMEGMKSGPRWMWMTWMAFLLLAIAAVNPQWGFRSVSVEHKTADIYILLDISNSMLAEDIPPSRLERARRFALDLSTQFRTDKIGLILFAGNAYIQSPLTTDWQAIQLYLNAAHPDQAGTQGTAIGKAVRLAIKPKEEGRSGGQGAIVILTDGEDHDTDAPASIAEAVEAGWITFVIGVGTETGGPIPISIDGRKDIKRDNQGQPVQTAMNRSLMVELSQKGNGKYFDINDGPSVIADLKKEFAGLERSQLEKRSFSEHKSYFQWFLLPALIILMLMPMINLKHDVI